MSNDYKDIPIYRHSFLEMKTCHESDIDYYKGKKFVDFSLAKSMKADLVRSRNDAKIQMDTLITLKGTLKICSDEYSGIKKELEAEKKENQKLRNILAEAMTSCIKIMDDKTKDNLVKSIYGLKQSEDCIIEITSESFTTIETVNMR